VHHYHPSIVFYFFNLNAQYCTLHQSPPELPPSLKTLKVTECNEIHNWPMYLGCNYSDFLQSLPELPSYLETLHVTNCKSLQSLPELPPSLETLKCVWMEKFNRRIHFFKEFKMIHDKIACLDRVFKRRFNFWYFYESFWLTKIVGFQIL